MYPVAIEATHLYHMWPYVICVLEVGIMMSFMFLVRPELLLDKSTLSDGKMFMISSFSSVSRIDYAINNE